MKGKVWRVWRTVRAEAVMQALIELEEEFNKARNDQQFMKNIVITYMTTMDALPHFTTLKPNKTAGGAKIYLKREDLNHTVHTKSTTHWASLTGKTYGKEAHHC